MGILKPEYRYFCIACNRFIKDTSKDRLSKSYETLRCDKCGKSEDVYREDCFVIRDNIEKYGDNIGK